MLEIREFGCFSYRMIRGFNGACKERKSMNDWEKRAADAERNLVNEAEEVGVSVKRWEKIKEERPDITTEDYKRIRKREKEIEATTKPKFGASTKPAKISMEKATKTTPPPQAKNLLGATPGQQDDLLCANQMSFK